MNRQKRYELIRNFLGGFYEVHFFATKQQQGNGSFQNQLMKNNFKTYFVLYGSEGRSTSNYLDFENLICPKASSFFVKYKEHILLVIIISIVISTNILNFRIKKL